MYGVNNGQRHSGLPVARDLLGTLLSGTIDGKGVDLSSVTRALLHPYRYAPAHGSYTHDRLRVAVSFKILGYKP